MLILHPLTLLRTLSKAKLIAVTRRSFPLLEFTPSFIFWQALILRVPEINWLEGVIWSVAAMLLLVLAKIRARSGLTRSAILWGALAGVLSGSVAVFLSLVSPQPAIDQKYEGNFVIEMLGAARYQRVGELNFIARLQELAPLSAEQHRPAFRARCSARDLPWLELGKSSNTLGAGAILAVRATITPLADKGWQAQFDNSDRRKHKVQARCKILFAKMIQPRTETFFTRARDQVIARVRQLGGQQELAALPLSIGLGVRDILSVRTTEAFKKTGMAHLLVLSGYQIGVIYFSVQFIFAALFFRLAYYGLYPQTWNHKTPANLCALLAILFLVALAGWENSSTRAIIAAVLGCLALQSERKGGMLNGILIALLVMSAIWPGVYLEVGVQLTFAALFGIMLGASADDGSKFMRGLKATLYASLLSSLVAAAWFGKFAWIGLVLNILLAPIITLLGCYGLLATLALSPISTPLAALVLKVAGSILVYIRETLVVIARSEWITVAPGWGLLLIAFVTSVLLIHGVLSRWYRFAVLSGVGANGVGDR